MSDSPNSWAAKLKDPRWQRRRLEIFARDNWRCTHCGNKTASLQVHHLRYDWGKSPWEYEDSHLKTLCEPCHEEVSRIAREAKHALTIIQSSCHIRSLSYLLGELKAQSHQTKEGNPCPISNADELRGFLQSIRPADWGWADTVESYVEEIREFPILFTFEELSRLYQIAYAELLSGKEDA